jgi:hypothetical protein
VAVIPDLAPHADGLARIMLKEQLDTAHAPLAQRPAKRARPDHVMALILLAEDAGIALELAFAQSRSREIDG